jgi:hypothetical protein
LAKLNSGDLQNLANDVFGSQTVMLPVWQSLADAFYPERGDFTHINQFGTEYADHLLDSDPVVMRRDLADAVATLLRDGDDWFEVGVEGIEPDYNGRSWLEWATERQRGFHNARDAGAARALKQGDNDFITFGQCCFSVELNKTQTGLLLKNYHLRDCAWWDDEAGNVDGVIRRWKAKTRELVNIFGADKVSRKVNEKVSKNKNFDEVQCIHFVIPSSIYGDFNQYPFVSIYYDKDHDHVMEEVGLNYPYYVIPRFQPIAGSPYAISPATMTGLPNHRMLQAMSHTLIEAAERISRPPRVATMGAVKGDVDLSPDGITWVAKDYDEKMGAALSTLEAGGNWPIGDEVKRQTKETLTEAMFLNKIKLPDFDRDITAHEFEHRIKAYRRGLMPVLSPIEEEYNGQLCETEFNLLMSSGLMGSAYDIPDSLSGQKIKFIFKSPMRDAKGELLSQKYAQMVEMGTLKEGVDDNIDHDKAFRDASEGMDVPNGWLSSPETVQQKRMQRAMIDAEQQAREPQ